MSGSPEGFAQLLLDELLRQESVRQKAERDAPAVLALKATEEAQGFPATAGKGRPTPTKVSI